MRTLIVAMLVLLPVLRAAAESAPFPPGDPPGYAGKWEFLITPSQQGIAPEVKRANAGRQLEGLYMVFVGDDGKIDHLEVVRSIPGCDDWIARLFKSSPLDGVHQRMRFVHRVVLTFSAPLLTAPGAAPKYRAVSRIVMEPLSISTPSPKMPPSALKSGPKQGRYMLYVELDGSVSRVDVIQSIPGGDAAVTDGLKMWKYKPQPERVGFVLDLAFR